MLTTAQTYDIRKLYFEEGKNITEISQELGYDRKTIRWYILKDDWNTPKPKALPEAEFPKLDAFKADIDEWLTDDKKAKRKQRHTARRVYDRLLKKYGCDFNCSYRTVAGYVSKRKKEIFGNKTGYLPLEHIPGEAQVDFGDADYYEKGRLYSGKYLNLSFPHSNKGYFQLFKGENMECLLEGLIAIFEHIGGVPRRIWFDNTKTIVTKVLKEGGRNLTDGFIRFMEQYQFEAAFCNINAGHEKGNVEGKVGYHRRNMLVPVPEINNLIEFNQELLEKCEEDSKREHYRKDATIAELYAQDKAALLSLPAVSLDVSKYITVKTNGYGRFYLNNNLHEYSVSPKYANSRMLVKITANEVIPLDENHRVVVSHERLYGDYKQQNMQWLPYLTQLSRSPGALKYTGIYQILPESLQGYLEKCSKSDKGKILQVIAKLTKESSFESAVETVDHALKYDVTDADSLISLHNRIHKNGVELPPIHLAGNIPQLMRVTTNLAVYDATLLELRFFMNRGLDTKTQFPVILSGQNKLRKDLSRNRMEPIAQRVRMQYHLAGMSAEECSDYIEYRMKTAGMERPVFTEGAKKMIYATSMGLPRLVNLLSSPALYAAMQKNDNAVEDRHVHVVIADLDKQRGT